MSNGNSSALDNASNDANQNMSPSPAGSPSPSCGSAPTPDNTVSPDKTHWISIELIDELGKHVPYEDYRIILPDGSPVEGTLDRRGRAKITGIDSGSCKVSFPNRDAKDWEKIS
jgi:type VI secretion system secreted protein VgrG